MEYHIDYFKTMDSNESANDPMYQLYEEVKRSFLEKFESLGDFYTEKYV